VGCLVAAELYGRSVPLVVASEDVYGSITEGAVVRLGADDRPLEVLVPPG
jgi:hypothetical protein